MRTKKPKNKTTKAPAGGGVIGLPGGVAAGLAAGQIASGLKLLKKLRPKVDEVVPGKEDPMDHAQVKRILVPLDFSEPSRRALRFASKWAKLFRAEICLLHVVEPVVAVGVFGTVPMSGLRQDLVTPAKAALGELAQKEFPKSTRVSVEVRQGVPFDQITAVARSRKADLIIIATHGHTGLKHALMGSTAERVVRHSSCPVLTLHRSPTKRS